DIIYIYIMDGDFIGRGEAAPSKRYEESSELILSVLESGIQVPENYQSREHLWGFLKPQLRKIASLEAAINMAIWDLSTQKQNIPLYEAFGFENTTLPKTSYTISIGKLDELDSKLEESKKCSILKVKLGTPHNDKEIIRQIRRRTDNLIRIDANEGWDYETAKKMVFWLADQNVEFIEQPFPAKDLNDSIELKKKSPLEIFADENSLISNDIKPIRHAFHGINIKLMKCGSLEEGKKMIKIARENGLKVMLGCMVETSVGITNASHLAGEVDFVDLDGNLLIKNDPYSGVFVNDGRLVLPESVGSGVTLNSDYSDMLR
ncbi:MAG: dipeptide epimerase, partial [Candidatus Neomarinimicrobiota bacterium]